jgi:hypothetical protein
VSAYLWACGPCDQVSDPVASREEAAVLAVVHDGLWHRWQRTADVVRDDAAEPVVVAG